MRLQLIATIGLAVIGLAGQAGAQTVKSGTISADETWCGTANPGPIILAGPVVVGDGTNAGTPNFTDKATLTILPGCVVRGQPRTAAGAAGAPGSLTVSRSGRLIANGQATNTTVIVMTTAATDNDSDGNPDRDSITGALEAWESGDLFWDADPQNLPMAPLDASGAGTVQLWGGLIVLGSAPVNIGAGCVPATEGLCNVEGLALPGVVTADQATYGGQLPHDSSGEISYISIRHGGDQIGTANEINGITMAGVGDGTEFHHIEVYANFDDGIEWFGGTVNGDHLHVFAVGDDAVDTDQGYTGVNQFVFAVAPWFGEIGGGLYGSASGDKLGELDGDDASSSRGATINCRPRSSVQFWNVTGLGSKGPVSGQEFTPTAGNDAGVSNNRGMQYRNGFGGSVQNSVIANTYGQGIDVSTDTSACTGNATSDQVAACSTYAMAVTQSNVAAVGSSEQAALDCGDSSSRVTCPGTGCNVVNPSFGFGIVNSDQSFNPQGDANGNLVASLKTTPLNPELTGFSGTVGGATPSTGALLDRTATYRGAFDSSLSTLWVDGWTVLSIAGLIDN